MESELQGTLKQCSFFLNKIVDKCKHLYYDLTTKGTKMTKGRIKLLRRYANRLVTLVLTNGEEYTGTLTLEKKNKNAFRVDFENKSIFVLHHQIAKAIVYNGIKYKVVYEMVKEKHGIL